MTPEQFTGSVHESTPTQSRALSWKHIAAAGESNLVFIINELDKATSGNGKAKSSRCTA